MNNNHIPNYNQSIMLQQMPMQQTQNTTPYSTTSPASIITQTPTSELPPTLTEPIYTPGYLRLHIGDLMRVEFLIGNNMTDRVGTLKEVGVSFIILGALDGGSEILCDIYSIRLITIIQSSTQAQPYSSFPSGL